MDERLEQTRIDVEFAYLRGRIEDLHKRVAILEQPFFGRERQICGEVWPAAHGKHICKNEPDYERHIHVCQCGATKL